MKFYDKNPELLGKDYIYLETQEEDLPPDGLCVTGERFDEIRHDIPRTLRYEDIDIADRGVKNLILPDGPKTLIDSSMFATPWPPFPKTHICGNCGTEVNDD